MLSSKIKPGMKVAVYVDHLSRNTTFLTFQGEKKGLPHNWGHRGVPQDATENLGSPYSRRRIATATVVAVKQKRFESAGRWSRYYTFKEDGIHVAFDEPVVVERGGSSGGATVEEAVVSAKFILMTAEELNARIESASEAKVTMANRMRQQADAFGPRLAELQSQLDTIGIPTKLHEDLSGLYGRGVSMALNTALVDGERVPTSFGQLDVRVDRRVLEQLVAIAAKHGETVDRDRT